MNINTYELKNGQISNKTHNAGHLKDIQKAHDYFDIVEKNGYMLSLKRRKNGKIKVVFVSSDKEIFIAESDFSRLTIKEINEITELIDKKVSEARLDKSERKIGREIKNIAALNYMQNRYFDDIDDNMFGVKTSIYDFLNTANEYFNEMLNTDSNQKLTFINPGDDEKNALEKINKISKSNDSEIFFVKSNSSELSVIRTAEIGKISSRTEIDSYEEHYNMHYNFYELMKKIDNKTSTRFERAQYAYIMDNIENDEDLKDEMFTIEALENVSNILAKNPDMLQEEDFFYVIKVLLKRGQTTYKESDGPIFKSSLVRIAELIEDKDMQNKFRFYVNSNMPLTISNTRKTAEAIKMLNNREIKVEKNIEKTSNKDEIEKIPEYIETRVAKPSDIPNKSNRSKTSKNGRKRIAKGKVAIIVAAATLAGGLFIGKKISGKDNTPKQPTSNAVIDTTEPSKNEEKSTINVYEMPNVNSNIVEVFKDKRNGLVYASDIKKLTDQNGIDWLCIGGDRWIIKDYLIPNRFVIDARDESDGVKIRQEANKNSNVMHEVADKEPIIVLDTVDNIGEKNILGKGEEAKWCNVLYIDENKIKHFGYMSSKYVKLDYQINAQKEIETNKDESTQNIEDDLEIE